ncbi:MAG: transposase [Candidatus Omnitrophica bacterium]|nr:transposase [Candidatus Omnitrophota bacterium]
MYRKYPLVTGETYHILTKSIAGFKIFDSKGDFSRMLETIRYYQIINQPIKFSRALELKKKGQNKSGKGFDDLSEKKEKLLEIIAYSIMPTHLHLVLRQLKEKGISIFMNKILNSYTHYFNLLNKRKGPLWEGPFKNILVKTDEQLFHLTRYIHLNPTTACLVNKPEDWSFSSYREYLGISKDKVCKYDDFFKINPDSYKKFVEDRIFYQRDLAKIKNLMLD